MLQIARLHPAAQLVQIQKMSISLQQRLGICAWHVYLILEAQIGWADSWPACQAWPCRRQLQQRGPPSSWRSEGLSQQCLQSARLCSQRLCPGLHALVWACAALQHVLVPHAVLIPHGTMCLCSWLVPSLGPAHAAEGLHLRSDCPRQSADCCSRPVVLGAPWSQPLLVAASEAEHCPSIYPAAQQAGPLEWPGPSFHPGCSSILPAGLLADQIHVLTCLLSSSSAASLRSFTCTCVVTSQSLTQQRQTAPLCALGRHGARSCADIIDYQSGKAGSCCLNDAVQHASLAPQTMPVTHAQDRGTRFQH